MQPASPEPPAQSPPKERKPPLIERWQARREQRRKEADEASKSPAPPEPVVAPITETPERVPELAPAAQPRITSKPMQAQEFASTQRVGIAGRLRWQQAETSQPEAEERVAAATTWRAVDAEGERGRTFASQAVTFLLHVLLAFVAGAILLAIAAAVASLTSDGRVALLEARGLPILIAGSTAIIIFSLLRTGPRAATDRRSTAIGILLGFVILVGAVALVYQPSLMARAQRELDRSLGVFGPDVAQAVQDFGDDVDQWNAEVNRYRLEHLRNVSKARDEEPDPAKLSAAEETFRFEAGGTEAALDGIYKRMVNHADGAKHAPLREALHDLAAVFNDELSGIKQITRGFVNDDQSLILGGDTMFKAATVRASELYQDRIEPILERGDIDPGPLKSAVGELRRPGG